MKKALKFTAFGLIGLLALLLVVAGIFAATFNPNDYKSLIVKLVQEKKQRTLHLDGDVKLAFWPKLGADLGKISLSEHNGNQEFASINSAKVSLALLPLLKKQLVVDTVYVDGVNANIIRFKDGTTNFDDLISKDEEASEEVKFDVDGINITNTSINFADEMRHAKYHITQFNLKTGHVALARPFDVKTNFKVQASNPNVDANFKLSGNFMADLDAKHYVAKDLEASVKGTLATLTNANITLAGDVDAKPENMELLVDGLKFGLSGNQAGADLALNLAAPKLRVQKEVVTGKQATITFSQSKRSDVTKANLTIADIQGSPQSLQSSGISGEVFMKQGARNVQSKFSSPFSGNLEKLIFDLPKLAAQINVTDPSLPKGAMKGTLNISIHSALKQEKINTNLDIDVDDLHLKGNIGIASFSNPIIQFNLDLNKLDADKYITKSDKPAAKQLGDTPIDLSALKKLNVVGSLHIGDLKVANIQTNDVNLKLNASQGIVELAPFSANLYEGSMSGSLRVDARSTPSIAFKQNMTGIAIGPLMVDAINNDMLNGKGTLNVDITTTGNTVGALKKSLNGTAGLNLADGAVKGIDIAGTLRSIKDKLNFMKQSSAQSDKTKKTDFSEMVASFTIKNGVAHNEDLSIKAPLFRIGGNGDIDIGNETINYAARPTIVNSLKGQGGSDLSLMNGLTIPIKVTGTFAKPNYGFDFSGLAAGIAKNKLLENIGGKKADTVKSLLGLPKTDTSTSANPASPPAATPAPTSIEDKAKKKLNKLLGF